MCFSKNIPKTCLQNTAFQNLCYNVYVEIQPPKPFRMMRRLHSVRNLLRMIAFVFNFWIIILKFLADVCARVLTKSLLRQSIQLVELRRPPRVSTCNSHSTPIIQKFENSTIHWKNTLKKALTFTSIYSTSPVGSPVGYIYICIHTVF
jgi:hypothetical protein